MAIIPLPMNNFCRGDQLRGDVLGVLAQVPDATPAEIVGIVGCSVAFAAEVISSNAYRAPTPSVSEE